MIYTILSRDLQIVVAKDVKEICHHLLENQTICGNLFMEGQEESIPFEEFLDFKLKYVNHIYVYSDEADENLDVWVFRINKHQ